MKALLSEVSPASDNAPMTRAQAAAIVASYHLVFTSVSAVDAERHRAYGVDVLDAALRVMLDAEAEDRNEGDVVHHAADVAWSLLGDDASDETNELIASALIEVLQVELCAAFVKKASGSFPPEVIAR